MSKICKDCNIDKVLTEYHKNKSGTNGYHNVCKDCRSTTRKNLNYEALKEGIKNCSKCKLTLNISNFNKDMSPY